MKQSYATQMAALTYSVNNIIMGLPVAV